MDAFHQSRHLMGPPIVSDPLLVPSQQCPYWYPSSSQPPPPSGGYHHHQPPPYPCRNGINQVTLTTSPTTRRLITSSNNRRRYRIRIHRPPLMTSIPSGPPLRYPPPPLHPSAYAPPNQVNAAISSRDKYCIEVVLRCLAVNGDGLGVHDRNDGGLLVAVMAAGFKGELNRFQAGVTMEISCLDAWYSNSDGLIENPATYIVKGLCRICCLPGIILRCI